MRELGISYSPALEQVALVQANIAAAMAEDSHQIDATCHLHPSPSLDTAKYYPLAYAEESP